MPKILIQPCASDEARGNWSKTMQTKIRYLDPPYRDALESQQLTSLHENHETGEVNFWGASAVHDKAMSKVGTGDIALFAWDKKIRAIGEIGHSFRNQQFADLLWKNKDSKTSFVNVYSLLSFTDTDFPYQLMPDSLRPRQGQGFRRGQLVENATVIDEIIEAFGIVTGTAKIEEEVAEEGYANSLAERNIELEIEKHRENYQRMTPEERTITVGNVESALVHEYVEWDSLHTFHRFSCSAGVTDLHSEDNGEVNLFEAKGGNSTRRVREAVAQLLHYAPYIEKPVTRLTALFPAEPKPMDVAYLHRLGIDCVFRVGSHAFTRNEAPGERRAHMLPVWNDVP